jgi:hypothetical protein
MVLAADEAEATLPFVDWEERDTELVAVIRQELEDLLSERHQNPSRGGRPPTDSSAPLG